MTLIASLSKDGGPVIIGDLLVSTSEPGVPSLTSTPLWNTVDGSWRTSKGMSVGRMLQKVSIISPRLCVAYAGSMTQASDYVDYLREIELTPPPSLHHDIMRYKGDTSSLDIIAYCKEDGGFRFYSNLPEETVGSYTNVRLGGTGAVAAERFLKDSDLGHPVGVGSSYDVNVLTACCFVGTLASRQARDGYGIEDAWGGGFEIATYYDDGFKKLDNILYLFWRFEQISENGYRVIIDPTYTFQWTTGENSNFITDVPGDEKFQWHLVSPLWDTQSPISAPALPLMRRPAEFIINCIEIKSLSGEVRHGGFCQRSGAGDHAVFKNDGNIGIEVNNQLICAVVSDALPSNACVQEYLFYGVRNPWPPSLLGPITDGTVILPACTS